MSDSRIMCISRHVGWQEIPNDPRPWVVMEYIYHHDGVMTIRTVSRWETCEQAMGQVK